MRCGQNFVQKSIRRVNTVIIWLSRWQSSASALCWSWWLRFDEQGSCRQMRAGSRTNNHKIKKICCASRWRSFRLCKLRHLACFLFSFTIAHQKAAAAANAEAHTLEKKLGYMLPPNQRSAQMRSFNAMAPSSRTYFRTRPAIYFIATQMMKQVRRVGEHIFKPRRAARRPFHWINSAPIKEHYQNADTAMVQRSKRARIRRNIPMNSVALRLLGALFPGTYDEWKRLGLQYRLLMNKAEILWFCMEA